MNKKKIIIISIISSTLILISCLVIYIIISLNKEEVKYSGTISDESELIEINSDSKSIDEASPREMVSMALWRIKNTKEFSVTTTGYSKAVGFKENILNQRIVKNNEAMITCVADGMISNASQRYFINGNVYLRESSKINKELIPTFDNDKPEIINNEEYINRYGWLPYQAFGYIVNKDTYKKEPTSIKNDDGSYSISISLDMKSNACYYYKREISINAKSVEVPKFYSVELVMTINKDFYIQKIDIKEEYEVSPKTVSFLGMIKTKTNICDTYSYDNIEFNNDYYNYFKENIK